MFDYDDNNGIIVENNLTEKEWTRDAFRGNALHTDDSYGGSYIPGFSSR